MALPIHDSECHHGTSARFHYRGGGLPLNRRRSGHYEWRYHNRDQRSRYISGIPRSRERIHLVRGLWRGSVRELCDYHPGPGLPDADASAGFRKRQTLSTCGGTSLTTHTERAAFPACGRIAEPAAECGSQRAALPVGRRADVRLQPEPQQRDGHFPAIHQEAQPLGQYLIS